MNAVFWIDYKSDILAYDCKNVNSFVSQILALQHLTSKNRQRIAVLSKRTGISSAVMASASEL